MVWCYILPKEHSRTRGYLGLPKSQIGWGSNPKAERPRDISAPVERELTWCPSVMASSPPPHPTPEGWVFGQSQVPDTGRGSLSPGLACTGRQNPLGPACSCSVLALLCGPSDSSQPRTYEGGAPPVLLMEAEMLCHPLKRVGNRDI